MRGEGRRPGTEVRIRRARRQDVAALLECVGGPAAGRVRALRRLLKTLAADVYVVDRAGAVEGVVAIHYRRSLACGGLLATIDAMMSLRSGEEQRSEDLALLADCALERARRRGCVGVDSAVEGAEARRVLGDMGFEAGPERLGRSLRPEEEEG